jgi:hypothetical protein
MSDAGVSIKHIARLVGQRPGGGDAAVGDRASQPDQAALLRLLARLECFRARMTEVRRVRDTAC